MPVIAFVFIGMAIGFVIVALTQIKATRPLVSGVAAHAGVWLSYTSVRILPDVAAFFARSLLRAFQETGPTMAVVFSQLLAEITGEELPPSEIAGLRSSRSILDAGTQLAHKVVPDITGALFPAGPITPQEARAQAERLLGVSLSFALDSWADHTVLELTSLGQLSWAADVSEAVRDGLGLQRVTRRAMQAIYGRAIGEQLEAYLNTVYRPTRLRAGEAIDAWQQGLLGDDQALRALAEEGYSFDLATLLMNRAQKDFTLEQAQQLVDLGAMDEAKLRAVVRRQGYGDQRAELIVQWLLTRRTRGILEDLADTSRRLFREGVLDDGELTQVLGRAGYRSAEIDLVLVREELALRSERQLSPGQILEAYREGVFDAGDARDRLRALHFTDDSIDVLLATQAKRLSSAQVIDALTRGIIPDARARQLLEQQGYRGEDVDVLLDLRVRRLTAGQVLDAVTRGLLNPPDARKLLLQQGFAQDVADLLLAFQGKRLSVSDITAALLRGIIGEPEALNRLLSLGYERADAEVLLRIRFQLLSSGEILDAYDGGLVTRGEARGRLQALGFSLDDSDLLLRLFEAKRAREGKSSAS